MSNRKLGAKRTCSNCETRFFDLNKEPAECPRCNTAIEDTGKSTVKTAQDP